MRVGRRLGLSQYQIPFQPSQLSGLRVWLRGDQGITPNGSAVSAWADISGNGFGVSQGTGSLQPAFVSSAINGQPGLHFNSSGGTVSQRLNWSSNSNVILTGTAAERFYVVKNDADPPAHNNGVEVNWGSTSLATYLSFSDGQIYDGFASTSRSIFARGANFSNPTVYDSYSQANDWRAFVNGTQQFSTGTNTYATIGATPALGVEVLDQTICEVILYSRVLSSTERTQVTRYLGSRYGITVP